MSSLIGKGKPNTTSDVGVYHTIKTELKSELCFCHINSVNTISSMIVRNVYSVLGDMRVHTNGVIVFCRVGRAPFNG